MLSGVWAILICVHNLVLLLLVYYVKVHAWYCQSCWKVSRDLGDCDTYTNLVWEVSRDIITYICLTNVVTNKW